MATDPRTTAAEIAKEALALVGAFPASMRSPNEFERRRAVSALDKICSHMAGKTELPFLRRTWLVPLTAETETYDLVAVTAEGSCSPRDVERWRWATLLFDDTNRRKPLEVLDEEQYRSRDQRVRTGEPCAVWVEHTLSPILHVSPQAAAVDTYTVELIGQIEAINLAGENELGEVQIEMPSSWRLMLEYKTAAHIGRGPVRRLQFNRLRELDAQARDLERELMEHSRPESHKPRQIEPWGND